VEVRLITLVLVANERVLEHMIGWLAEDDPDAQDRLFRLIYRSLVGADALNSASDFPDYVSASLRVTSTDAFPEEPWLSERVACYHPGVRRRNAFVTSSNLRLGTS
jgi:hypothetical protein